SSSWRSTCSPSSATAASAAWRCFPRVMSTRRFVVSGTRQPLVDVALAALPVGLAQFALEQLAGWVAGEDLGEVDRRRALEAGELVAAELDQLGVGDVDALGLHHDCLHGLTPAVVRNADDGD